MSGFSVNLSALQAMQAQLQRAADDVAAIRAQLGKIDDSAFSGFLLSVRDKFDAVLHAQIGSAVDAQSATQNAAYQIGNSRQYYTETDQTEAARFDSTVTTGPKSYLNEVPEPNEPYTGPYADVNNPQGRLVEPPSYDEEMTWKPTIENDLGSIPSFVRDVVKLVTGVDPLGYLEQFAAGDWKEVRRIADRFNNVAWAFRDCCDNISNCQDTSTNDWVGNTGDSVRNYLVLLAGGFYGEYQKNQWLAQQLTDLAEGVFDGMNVLVGIASDWINSKLLPAIATLGLASATQEIPVADFIIDGAAAWNAWKAIQDGIEVYDRANKIKTLIDAFSAALTISQNGSLNAPFSAPSLPDDTYTTPVGY